MSTDLFKLMQKEKERVAKLPPIEQELERAITRLNLVTRQLERNKVECRRAKARQQELEKLPFDQRPYGIPDCYESRSRLKSQKKRLENKIKELKDAL